MPWLAQSRTCISRFRIYKIGVSVLVCRPYLLSPVSSLLSLLLQATALGCTGFWSSHTWCRAWRDSAECRQFCHLTDNEDRVLGAFLVGRVQQGKQIKGSRRAWQDKVQWKTEASE